MTESDANEQVREILEQCHEQLGIEEDPTGFLSSASAHRYLRGYHGDARKSVRNLCATHAYREELSIEGIGTNPETAQVVWNEIEKRSLFLAVESDVDNNSSPIVVIRKRKESFDIKDFEDYRRSLFFLLDCTAKLADLNYPTEEGRDKQMGQWIIVMDMSDFKNANSPPRSVTMETLRIFQSHFPERARQIVVYNAPYAFTILFRCLCPFIDTVTKNKFLFLNSQSDAKKIETLSSSLQEALSMTLEQGKQNMIDILLKHAMLAQVDMQQSTPDNA